MSDRPFRFGVQCYASDSPAKFRETARHAESLGYSALHLADHYFGPGPAMTAANHPLQNLAAVPAMAVAIEATTTLRVGCRVFCVDYHQPVVLAKELATLDFFSEGRVEIGLGAGWITSEYHAMGIAMDGPRVRIDRLRTTTGFVRQWFESGQMCEGDRAFEATPRRSDGTCPPIMIGGGAQRILTTAGEIADIVSLNFDNSAGAIGAKGIASGVPERTREKLAWIRAGAARAGRADPEIEIGAYFATVTDSPTVVEKTAGAFGMTVEQFSAYPHALAGPVAAVVDECERRRSEYAITYITVGAAAMASFAPVVAALNGR